VVVTGCDPVRFLGNRSSGRQGYALAMTAVARGAEVTLISANVGLADPAGAKVVRVGSADELRTAVLEAATNADVVVMAAAVADFRPVSMSTSKIKKSDADPPALELTRNPDVLAELGRPDRAGRAGQVIVGFAAETDDVMANGRVKLASKGADLLVVNEVGSGRGFDVSDNAGVVLSADGSATPVPAGPKAALADVVWDLAAIRLNRPPAVS
jgi:phosphopantothenoylcysteine decarboxylase/phosphopantothenate--cysteine ligase